MKRGIILLIALFTMIMLVCPGTAAPSEQAINAYNKGVDLAVGGNFSQALESIDQALALDQNFTLAWVTRAGILNVMGDFNQSLEASERALAIDQNQPEAWTNRASALISLGRDVEGLESADRAIELDPRLSEAWIDRATALSNLGRTQEADEAMQMVKFLTQEPEAVTSPVATTAKAPLSWILVPSAMGAALGYFLKKRDSL
ncbi:MAG: tetratricopeptide repeat protein [Methanolinea sp.]|jgi:tetratricopeptide (TPR) repeat protein|nr:tetratricopeptide repeat protein [Methanolinea sp.]